MRKTTKFDGAPWAVGEADKYMSVQPQGRRQANVMNKSMRRTGGRRGA